LPSGRWLTDRPLFPAALSEAPDLDALSARIRACRICRDAPWGAPLPHEPRPVFRVSRTATICVREPGTGHPGPRLGTPFTDASGDRLRTWMGVDLETFYDGRRIAITPMGFAFRASTGMVATAAAARMRWRGARRCLPRCRNCGC
jgi:uracil-DNA glycosylase